MADFFYTKKTQKICNKWRLVIVVFMCLVTFVPNSAIQAAQNPDPFLFEQWYLDEISAQDFSSHEQDETIVAILDAGFDLDHEDLKNRYWKNTKEIAGNNKDDDSNGFVDDINGWDFVDSDSDPSPVIGQKINDTVASHGTLLSGIIAASTNNGIGIAGITSNTKIMPLRIVDENGVGITTDVRSAIKYAVENGADVINLSFTSKKPDTKLQETIKWAVDQGVVVVSAIGNNETDTDISSEYPACFDKQIGRNTVIGVASTNKNKQKANFSNYGISCVDISAPGVNIFGAVYNDSNNFLFSTSYGGPWEGTSMSAPMVAGGAAVLLSSYPSLTPDQVRLSLMLSADPVKESSLEARRRLGSGLLNIKKALDVAAEFAKDKSINSASNKKPSGTFVTAEGAGSKPIVSRLDSRGTKILSFLAYDSKFLGGVSLAMGDVDGNGTEEIITGPGKGGGPQVRVFDLKGNVRNQFFAFDEWGREGINVTTGDVLGDSRDEIIVTSDKGGTGQVRIFNQYGHLQRAFYPFGRTSESVHVAVGNMDDDSANEIIVTLGGNTEPLVKIFDANGRYVRGFTALNKNIRGLNVEVGDLDSDGYDEIIVSADSGNSPMVGIYSRVGQVQQNFFAYDQNFLGGVSLTVGDIDKNGRAEIYTAPGKGGGPHIRIFEAGAELIGGFFISDSTNRFGAKAAIW